MTGLPKPHIKVASHVFMTHHPEWKFVCQCLDEKGFTWVAYGKDFREAYTKWCMHKPYFPTDVPK